MDETRKQTQPNPTQEGSSVLKSMARVSESIPMILRPGKCVRCSVGLESGYLCDSCEKDNERILEARRSRDAMDDLARRLRDSGLSPRYRSGAASLETFIDETPHEKAAKQSIKAMVEGKSARPWLYIYGPAGTGKTHLAASALAAFVAAGGSGRFVSLVDLLGRMRRSFGRDGENDYDILESYRSARLLVVDDLGTEKSTPWGIQVLTDLVNARYESGKATIITSNFGISKLASRLALPDEEIAAERIVDRIVGSSIIVNLDGDSHRS